MSNEMQEIIDRLTALEGAAPTTDAARISLLEDRLTALEAAKPGDSNPWVAVALAAHESKAADIDDLTRQRDNLGSALDKAAADVKHERERNAALVTEVAKLNTFLAQQAAMVRERTYERDNLGGFVDALKDDNKRLTDEVKRLTAERDQVRAQYRNLWKDYNAFNQDLKDRVAHSNALAAQVDDLRNVNAGLRKDNERLRTVYETDNARLRNALEEVEWCDGACPWCHGRPRGLGHSVACHRQAALR